MGSVAFSTEQRLRSPLVFSYAGMEPDRELMEWVRQGLVSGVVVFGENALDETGLAAAVTQLRAVAPGQFRIMIDEEGGAVCRLPGTDASMEALCSYESRPLDETATAYERVAARLARLGIDTLLAPVVDLRGSESSWLRERTFSRDPERVAAMAKAVVPAVQARGVHACVKHFPGTRTVRNDPHLGVAIDQTVPSLWEKEDAVPFRAAVIGGVHMVMVGHQRVMGFDPTQPACMSPLVVRALLRERLGFGGLVLSDDLAMGAIAGEYAVEDAVRGAIKAGCNLLLICNDRPLQRRALAAWREISGRVKA